MSIFNNREFKSLKKEFNRFKKSFKKTPTLKKEYFKIYGGAGYFSNEGYLDFYLNDNFEDDFKKITMNLDDDSKKFYKWIFLRALFVHLINLDNLYLNEELEKQRFFSDVIHNNTFEELSGFKFTGEYNLHPFIDLGLSEKDKEFLKDKDIIDAGAFTGDTALPLSRLTQKKVYAFEPFEYSFNLLKKNIQDNNIENIVPIRKTIGDEIGKRTLFLAGDNYQGITNDSEIREYDTEIIVDEITIDEFVQKNNLNVGLIMVDVEGMESNLLKGAINTIKTQKPILDISIYHNSNDFFNIIPWIANLNVGYTFEINKEQPCSFLADTSVRCKVKE